MKDSTRAVHGTAQENRQFRSLSPPLLRASTVVFDDVKSFESRGQALYDGYSYGLYGTPLTRRLEDSIAALESGTRSLLTPSGLAALTLTTMTFARPGSRILMSEAAYPPTRDMARVLMREFGVDTEFYDPCVGPIALLDDSVSLIWVESPGSMTFEVQDLPAIVTAAKAQGVIVAADATWGAMIGCKPLALGADISVQSLSKYPNGHSDVLMGSITVADVAHFRRLKDRSRLMGYGVGGDDVWLCLRGLSTLPIRYVRSAATAGILMDWCADWLGEERILHPSRTGHPGHALFQRDFTSGAGLFSIVIPLELSGRVPEAIAAMRIFQLGASWGGVHSLVATSDPRRQRPGLNWLVEGQVLRIAVGLEDPEDLIADLARFRESLLGPRKKTAEL